jgi:anthranilate synthase/aminodeoxychorismate synthase-like glutamine amidotransferase
MKTRIVVIDNYDSFAYNLVQYVGELGAEPIVVRNDAVDIDGIAALRPDGLLISPGPGTPKESGISREAIDHFARRGTVVFGVCLGHQCIGEIYGGVVVRAPQIMHGKTSIMHHDGEGVFTGIEQNMVATRYHSLMVERESVPECLIVSATTDGDIIMGLRHRELPIEGVQFHPESILTKSGHTVIGNFLHQASLNAAKTYT